MLTLLRQASPLADARQQMAIIERDIVPSFQETLAENAISPLRTSGIQVLQINVGKLCNQTCSHCHVDAGPDRREIMSRETMDLCLDVMRRCEIPVLDITGGAPELNPHFRHAVSTARGLGRHVIDRCNLTILTVAGQSDLAQFLADHEVHVVASLPCYLESNCDRQRGDGVFQRSIEALRQLNALGYGQPGGSLELSLVYNPVGSSLPPPQESLEADYRRELQDRYGVSFTRLFTITNMPISRFLQDLLESDQYESYMQRIVKAFNPLAVSGVMCRNMLSVDWQGRLFDCDFNQMLELELAPGMPRHIRDFEFSSLENRPIVTGRHCYGCTAGQGSSCQGAIAN